MYQHARKACFWPRATVSQAACAGLFALHVLTGPSASAAELIEIREVAWAADVQDQNATERYNGEAPSQTLYLWMRVEGQQQALDRLEAEGKLPIHHVWSRYIGTVPVRSERVDTDSIPLSAGSAEMLVPLRREVTERGFFDWRTWSRKVNVVRGIWEVKVRYDDDTWVTCGEPAKACRYRIQVR